MDKLLLYFNLLSKEERILFCDELGFSESFLRKKISLGSFLHPRYCRKIEELTNGKVTRQDLRPNDWHEIWWELVNKTELTQ